MANKRDLFQEFISTLEQHTRGAQIGIYTIAGLGLAFAVHKVRPISKFSQAKDVPSHFLKNKEILNGRVVGWQHSSEGTRLLIDHSPPIWIPIWHSSKPALPVQIWGVKLIGSNGGSWLQCIAVGQKASIVPLSRGKDALIGDVTLHLPITYPKEADAKKKQKRQPSVEHLHVGERLVELGLGVVSPEAAKVPAKSDNKWFWLPWIFFERSNAELLQRAQSRAMTHRTGLWRDEIPLSRLHLVAHYIKSLLPVGSGKKTPSVL